MQIAHGVSDGLATSNLQIYGDLSSTLPEIDPDTA